MSEREYWIDLIRNEYDPKPDLGRAAYPAFDAEWDDAAGRIADAILTDRMLLLRKHADEFEQLRAAISRTFPDTSKMTNEEVLAAIDRMP